MQQMRLPKPHITVDKEGIIGAGRMACHRQAGRVRKLVTGSHHKCVEGKPRVACLSCAGGWSCRPVDWRCLRWLWVCYRLCGLLDDEEHLVWYARACL